MHFKDVGIIGLGAMGFPMAKNLLRSGFSVFGFDIDQPALKNFEAVGGKVVSSPTELARTSTLLLFMVNNVEQVESILFNNDFYKAIQENSTIWIACTLPPDALSSFEKRLQPRQIQVLDGPVSGGVAGAAAAELTIIAAGPEMAFARAKAAMQAVSKKVFNLGPKVGQASLAKMVNQLLVASQLALTAEALNLSVMAGLDVDTMYDVIRNSSGDSRIFRDRFMRMHKGQHVPNVTVDIFLKDLGIVMNTASAMNCAVPVGQAAFRLYKEASDHGHGSESDTLLASFLRQKEYNS